MIDQQIIALEEKIAHLEHGIQTLGETVYAQQRQIDRLIEQVRLMSEQITPLIEAKGSRGGGHELPPHY